MSMRLSAGRYPGVHRLRLLTRYLSGAAVCPGLPPTVVIANTHACNHFCRMCIREAVKFAGPNMEVRLFRKLIDEGADYFRYISLDGPGETIMNPEAFGMIRYARSKGIRMVFSTNAVLMDDHISESILDSGLDHIIFSLNGTTREVYASVHGASLSKRTATFMQRPACCTRLRRSAMCGRNRSLKSGTTKRCRQC